MLREIDSQRKEHARIVNVNAVDFFFFRFKFYLDLAAIMIKQTFFFLKQAFLSSTHLE